LEFNKLLSVVIPTYNRADFLDYSLEVHIPMCREFNIQIFVSDNASDDNTEQVVKKWMREYDYLQYSKNATNIGPDGNFEKALKMPDTEYIWLLGDTYRIPSGAFEYIHKKVKEKDYDLFVFNLGDKLRFESQDYIDGNELLHNLGALMTCAAVNVYNKKLIDRADFSKYYNSHYIQTGIILEDIAKHNFLINWTKELSIRGLKHSTLKKTNWSKTSKVFEIAIEAWINLVISLPSSYKFANKMKAIMDFGKVSRIFSIKNLLILRSINILNRDSFNKNRFFFKYSIDYPLFLVFLISVIPLFLIQPIVKVAKFIKRLFK
jgi:abequosyltransferase